MSKDKILVLNGSSYARAIKGLGDILFNPFDFVRDIENYKLVMFTGGEDVSPALYGDKSPNNLCGCNPTRDEEEAMIFHLAADYNIPMAGICRGAQFINVMSGGKMIHHLDGHGYTDHNMICSHSETPIRVNSLHHQMIIPGEDGIVVGWAETNRSTTYFGNEDEPVAWDAPESEVILYPSTRSFGAQYHPEIMDPASEGYLYFYNAVDDLMEMDIETFTRKYTGKCQKSLEHGVG